jgi:dTMP kinase
MFITLEGSEGSGKSTQAIALADFLREKGYPVLLTREPGGTPIGDQVRLILADLKNEDMLPRTEILLFQASRAQLVERVIRPHLQAGGMVLCDRYADSTLAYQGYGYQLVDLATLSQIVEFATGGLKPDLTLLLDIDPAAGLQRRRSSGDVNRLDVYDLTFYQRVRQGYLEMAQAEPKRWVIVDAGQSLEQVQAELRQIVIEHLAAVSPASPG